MAKVIVIKEDESCKQYLERLVKEDPDVARYVVKKLFYVVHRREPTPEELKKETETLSLY